LSNIHVQGNLKAVDCIN